MKTKFTGEEVKESVLENGIQSIDHHRCSICNLMVYYEIKGGELYFQPSCDCSQWHPPEPRSWQSAADWINMQSNETSHASIAKRFGLE
jgi:hypothetical protein